MSSDLKVTNIKHESSSSNNLVLGSDGNVSITNTLSAGTIGSAVTHGNINLQRIKTYSGVFESTGTGYNGTKHNILTMQDPGVYFIAYGFFRNSSGTSVWGHGRANVLYQGGSSNVEYNRVENSTSTNIDVTNTSTNLQLVFNTNSSTVMDVYYNYIVIASHDI